MNAYRAWPAHRLASLTSVWQRVWRSKTGKILSGVCCLILSSLSPVKTVRKRMTKGRTNKQKQKKNGRAPNRGSRPRRHLECKSLESVRLWNAFERSLFYVRQGCIYLIINAVKTVISWNSCLMHAKAMLGLFQELPCVGGELDEEAWSGSRLWWLAGCWPHTSREEQGSVITVILLHIENSCVFNLCKKKSYFSAGYDALYAKTPNEWYSVTGIYRCGPAAVKAISEKKVDMPFDVPFVYAEVNADVHKIILRNGKRLSCTVEKDRVGALICTKHPGSKKMQDITAEYKPKKGKRITEKKNTYF